jgi:hypothetical protein
MDVSPYLLACNRLNARSIIECINRGLDKSLGVESKSLLLKVLDIIYSLDEKDVPSSLDAFELLVEKILCGSAARSILINIAKE